MNCRAFGVALCLFGLAACQTKTTEVFRTEIPRTWDDQVMSKLELPLADVKYSPSHVPASFYYRIPVRPIYKTYPVYAPDREPPGYVDSLRQMNPELVWDATKFTTKEDWIRGGEAVFDAPFLYGGIGVRASQGEDLYVRSPEWWSAVNPPVSKDGITPAYRYAVREKGKIEIGILSCAMCHTRVMPDGVVLKGAQGNFPFDRAFAQDLRQEATLEINRKLLRALYYTPWVKAPFFDALDRVNAASLARGLEGTPPGAVTRHRSTVGQPIQVPDLIGVEHRKYLDHTGLQPHRGVGDMMRYAALNQGGDDLSVFGGFRAVSQLVPGEVKPDDPNLSGRYSDDQLFALTLYLYSLKAPQNPHHSAEIAGLGKNVFEREGCGTCHTPPLYTNNKLTPVQGFTVPERHQAAYDILPVVVGTDARLALETRRGTGYYKAPSLLGVWYRGPFQHNGSVATLELWFDPARLSGPNPVRGHEYGLGLSSGDKAALLAFLRTL